MRWLTALLLSAIAVSGAAREVAITFDDLPRGADGAERSIEAIRAMTKDLVRPFRETGIPFAGFVNQGSRVDFGPEGLREILDIWLEAGAELGNHTHSHLNINSTTLADYTADITRGEPVVEAALTARNRTLRYFRHPFLFTGSTPETKEGLQAFLDAEGYTVAPVTFDNSDYMYAALYTRPEYRERVRREYVPYMESVIASFEAAAEALTGRDFPQILLVHANELNADLMPELLAMLRRRGYSFVTLEKALADEVYQQPEEYVGRNGFSWIHRWARTKGVRIVPEPEPPAWVLEAWERL